MLASWGVTFWCGLYNHGEDLRNKVTHSKGSKRITYGKVLCQSIRMLLKHKVLLVKVGTLEDSLNN